MVRNKRKGSGAGCIALCVAMQLAGCAGKIPLPKHLRVSGLGQLRTKLDAAQAPTKSYFADVDLTYFGPAGRVRGNASVAVRRPDQFRFDVRGPHGGVIQAFATDGKRVRLLMVGESRFIEDDATVANLTRLLPIAPVELDAAGWVSIFFGELRIPEGASLHYDDERGHFVVTWNAGVRTITVRVDPATSRAVRVEIHASDKLLSRVLVKERGPMGIPVRLRFHAPGDKDVDMRIKLHDIDRDPDGMGEGTFVLKAPRGVSVESLNDRADPQGP